MYGFYIQSNIDSTTAVNMMANVGHQQVSQPQGKYSIGRLAIQKNDDENN